MATDEASQSIAPEGDTLENAPLPPFTGDDAAAT